MCLVITMSNSHHIQVKYHFGHREYTRFNALQTTGRRFLLQLHQLHRLGIQPLFGDEPVFSPRKTAGRVRLGSCHWRQQPKVYFHIEAFDGDSCSRASNLADFMQLRNIVSKPDLVMGVFWILWKLVFKSWKNMKDCSPKSAMCRLATRTASHGHACLFTVEASNITASFHVVVQRAEHHLN